MSNRIVVAVLSAMLGIPAFGQATESLLVGSGDMLHIQIAETPELEQHARVTDSGDIPVTGAGMVKVSGLTPAAAAIAVRDKLIAAHYMNHPEVMISVEQFATQSVSVVGEVKSAGTYPIVTPRSILDVLALAGGLNPLADRDILIQRRSDTTHPIHYRFSNDSATAVATQVAVFPGDTVVVAKAGIVYVLGDVNRPGGFAMANQDSSMTVLQAIAAAGGLTKTAKQGRATLMHKETAGSASEKTISINDLQTGKTADMALLPGDVIYVPFSFGRNLATFGSAGIAAAAASASVYAIP
jgi:polysaccharide export outer membrane protein